MVSKKAIRRLRLRPGDIVVVKDQETMKSLLGLLRQGMPPGTPPCPIVFAPNGIHRLSQEYLRKLVTTEPPKTDAK